MKIKLKHTGSSNTKLLIHASLPSMGDTLCGLALDPEPNDNYDVIDWNPISTVNCPECIRIFKKLSKDFYV